MLNIAVFGAIHCNNLFILLLRHTAYNIIHYAKVNWFYQHFCIFQMIESFKKWYGFIDFSLIMWSIKNTFSSYLVNFLYNIYIYVFWNTKKNHNLLSSLDPLEKSDECKLGMYGSVSGPTLVLIPCHTFYRLINI